MEGGGPSSVLQCKSIVKSIIILDDKLICGLDNGAIELFQWENGIQLCLFKLYDLTEQAKSTMKTTTTTSQAVNDYQIIHLCIIDYTAKIILAQCRNGDLFIIDLTKKEPIILSLIRSKTESFVKVNYFDNPTEKDTTIKKIIASSDKDNEVLIVDLINNYQSALTSNKTLSNPTNINDDSDNEDNDSIISNKSLVNCIMVNREKKFIVLSFESCLIQLTSFDFNLIAFLNLNEGKTAEPIITMTYFTINDITFIAIGLFSTKGIILQYTQNQNSKLTIAYVINDLSSSLRCGISSIYYSHIIKVDLLSIETEETKQTDLLCFGGYDHRVKFYDFSIESSSSSKLQLKPMGNLILPNEKIINQIIIATNKDQSYYLFVASDQRLLYIYSIA